MVTVGELKMVLDGLPDGAEVAVGQGGGLISVQQVAYWSNGLWVFAYDEWSYEK